MDKPELLAPAGNFESLKMAVMAGATAVYFGAKNFNARAKAEILCKASGAELGQLISIDYNWGEVNIISRTSYEMEDCLMPLAAMGKCCTPEIEPDDIDVSDTVAFTWEIK